MYRLQARCVLSAITPWSFSIWPTIYQDCFYSEVERFLTPKASSCFTHLCSFKQDKQQFNQLLKSDIFCLQAITATVCVPRTTGIMEPLKALDALLPLIYGWLVVSSAAHATMSAVSAVIRPLRLGGHLFPSRLSRLLLLQTLVLAVVKAAHTHQHQGMYDLKVYNLFIGIRWWDLHSIN